MDNKEIDITETRKAEIKFDRFITEGLEFGGYKVRRKSRKRIVVANEAGECFELSFRSWKVSDYLKMREKLIRHAKDES